MRVLDIATRTILDVEDCYGARLIGQGKAVLVPKTAKKPEKKVEPAEPKAEEPKAKAKKG